MSGRTSLAKVALAIFKNLGSRVELAPKGAEDGREPLRLEEICRVVKMTSRQIALTVTGLGIVRMDDATVAVDMGQSGFARSEFAKKILLIGEGGAVDRSWPKGQTRVPAAHKMRPADAMD
tara:strand:+ start:309 stop:671 length:363 start_codon:yes stop_codon:yes gene_type:complete